jgi:hypothetical protein
MVTITHDCNMCSRKLTCKIDRPKDRITSSIPGGNFTISVCNDDRTTRTRLDTVDGNPIIDSVTDNTRIPRAMVMNCIEKAANSVMKGGKMYV